jgi:hypothetical protein
VTLETLARPWKSDLDKKKMDVYSHTALLCDIVMIEEGRDIALKGSNDEVCGWIPNSTLMREVFKQWKRIKA